MTNLKSQVVIAPAGSGKTELLSKRYIELLQQGVPPERILTITFTDKAATEMKGRILKRAEETDPELSRLLRENILKLRISTIHSFCFSLVRRFAYLLEMDPNPQALLDSKTLWQETKYEALMKIAEEKQESNEYQLLLNLISDKISESWNNLSNLLDRLFTNRSATLRCRVGEIQTAEIENLAAELRAHPVGKEKIAGYEDLFPLKFTPETIEKVVRQISTKDRTNLRSQNVNEKNWAMMMANYREFVLKAHYQCQFLQQFSLFREVFLNAYERAKRELGRVDYDDMELLALNLISKHEEWQNILYAFDERTDHILVDEFQDTSFLQWEIIDKLTEEWRSGEGAKTAQGISPTIFIVGDDKQSIYQFRGANVEVFTKAADKLERWLGKEKFDRVVRQENYRSLKAIIDFTNNLFSRLMAPESDGPAWRTRYAPFTGQRANHAPGRVEIILQPHEGKPLSEERRKIDAQIVARRIRLLVDSGYQIYETGPEKIETPRPCSYRDIAILIRNRNQLDALEKELRHHQIPFLVIGGTGFYQEPEIRYLIALTSFLIDPADDLALYITLRSPLFAIDEKELFLVCAGNQFQRSLPTFLWERVTRYAQPATSLAAAVQTLKCALSRVHYEPLYLIIDQLLTVTRGWERFWEPQRAANVKKFLQILQSQELEGTHLYHIKKFLELDEKDEARADVTTSGMDVVSIMTVHAAKGLQFPIVFHPGLGEEILQRAGFRDRLIIEEQVDENDTVETQIFYCPDSELRKTHPAFQTAQKKQLEEEKRVFYVACTRARDALFLTGTWDRKNSDKIEENGKTKLDWLKAHLGLTFDRESFRLNEPIDGVFCVNATALPDAPTPSQKAKEKPLPQIKKGPVPDGIITLIRSVTRYTPQDQIRHHPEAIALGDVFHRLFELLSSEKLSVESPELLTEVTRLLHQNLIPRDRLEKLARLVINQIHRLRNSPIWEVIKPQPNSFAELPLMYHDGNTLWTGRIDRLIVSEDEVRIYDYKTFPVKEKEIPMLKQEYYENQLKHYAAASAAMFPDRKIKTFLVFTTSLRIEPVG